MTYHIGTLSEFNAWHLDVKVKEGLPKYGYVNGVIAPENEQTTSYSDAIQNPDGSDNYIWCYGAYPIKGKEQLSQIDNLGWFTEA